MINCAKIAADVAMASCRQSAAGILGEAYLINFDDWQGATITESNGVISSITLATGANAFKLTSHDKAFEGSYSLNVGTYGNSFNHQAILRGFDRTQAFKDFMNKSANGRVVLILRNIDIANPATAYEVYGREHGLVASAAEFNSTDADGVVGMLTLASQDSARESAVPTSVYTTSLAATKTMLDGLLSA